VVTTTGQIVGSLPWASPEQAGGGRVAITPASDVYSIGIMLYQALTGGFPYAVEGSLLELLTHIANIVPRPPSQARQGCSNWVLDRVVMRALAKCPEKRYCDGTALAEGLREALQGGVSRSFYRDRIQKAAVVLIVAGLCLWGISTGHNVLPPQGFSQTVLQLPTLTNSVEMPLIRVPAGPFVMGSATGEDGAPTGIHTRLVTIAAPFFLGRTEVTQRQYEAVMHANPSDTRWIGPDLPVQSVTWEEANEFCRRLSQIEGRHYRLPTSAEWEYACRAGTTGPFGPSGTLDPVGWYIGNSSGAVHAVAGKQPNTWGFYDCHGNVAEWCSDIGMQAPREAMVIIRGGSFLRSEADCRSAAYSMGSERGRFCDVGFRVAMDP
jgi:formylglycine-generating enzyme required for sulfatase activity